MSAPNFYNVNASRVFAIDAENEFEYDDLKDNIFYGLQSVFGERNVIRRNESEDGWCSYPGTVVASILGKTKHYEIPEADVEVFFNIIVRSGYYAGGNVDWDIVIEVAGEEYDNIEEVNFEYCGLTKKQERQYAEYAKKFIRGEIERMLPMVEKVFEENTISLNCIGVFSNGEAIYEKA